MIVRISTVGQFQVPDEAVAHLNEMDNEAVTAVEAGDEARFRKIFESMVALVSSKGEELADDDLSESHVILPPPDTSFEEAAGEFTGEGLIPD